MQQRDTFGVLGLAFALALFPRAATAQGPSEPEAADAAEAPQRPEPQPASQPGSSYVPISGGQRINWIVDGTVGKMSLGVGVIAGLWDTALNTPEEWHRSASGFGKRYLEREADVAISSTIEAGVGAFWGEDPRYISSQRHGFWPRTRYAMKTVFLAQRRDGHLAPAWGRVAGNVFNNVIENTWLPPSVTTGGQTTLRSAQGFVGRLIGNLWAEFWPDIKKRLPG
jgi:hypothetical protein